MTLPNKHDEQDLQEQKSLEPQAKSRRDFIKKYGKLAAVTPLALSLAMKSQAQTSEGGGTDGGPGGY